MNAGEAQESLIRLWLDKAGEALASSEVSASLKEAREFVDLIRGLIARG